MSRIFISLSLLPILLVFATMTAGWWIGDYNGVYAQIVQSESMESSEIDEQRLLQQLQQLQQPQQRFKTHFQLGLASALATVLINSLSITYLIGTSRWVKEVCEAYDLDQRYVATSTNIKRGTFPWSIAGVSAILTIVAFGAASDPGTLSKSTAAWVAPHSIAAVVGSSLIVCAILIQAVNLQRNARVIEDVVEEVKQARLARGLPVE